MFIKDIQAKHEDGQYRVQAEAIHETRPLRETIFFSVPSEQAHWIRPEPNAFMVGTAVAAMWNGESRLEIEGAVDPQLRTRLAIAMRLLARWHNSPLRPTDILAPAAAHVLPDIPRSTTGMFLSGGVDSLSALYWNASQYPKGDPRRVSVAFFVHGLDVGDPNKPNRLDVWNLGIQTLSALCQELGVELVTVKVNLRNLAKSWRLYGGWQHASLLASIAHAASSRIYRCIIAPDYSVEYIPHPHGSHPWLNSYFGADFLEIITGDMEQFSRLGKVRFLSTQPGVLDALRVCWDAGAIPQGYLNCGRCLKCVRTMLAFMACGQLSTTKAFPYNDVTSEMMKATPIRTPAELELYLELLSPSRCDGAQGPDGDHQEKNVAVSSRACAPPSLLAACGQQNPRKAVTPHDAPINLQLQAQRCRASRGERPSAQGHEHIVYSCRLAPWPRKVLLTLPGWNSSISFSSSSV